MAEVSRLDEDHKSKNRMLCCCDLATDDRLHPSMNEMTESSKEPEERESVVEAAEVDEEMDEDADAEEAVAEAVAEDAEDLPVDAEEDASEGRPEKDDGEEDDDVSVDAEDPTEHTDMPDDEDDELTVKSDDASSIASRGKPEKTPPREKRVPSGSSRGSSAKKGRSPSVRGLTIPFRTVKKAMKLDPDTPIVQNEAAVMTTIAAELFLKSLAKKSHKNAKNRGRNTIRYEDIAEARTNEAALSFLETLLP